MQIPAQKISPVFVVELGSLRVSFQGDWAIGSFVSLQQPSRKAMHSESWATATSLYQRRSPVCCLLPTKVQLTSVGQARRSWEPEGWRCSSNGPGLGQRGMKRDPHGWMHKLKSSRASPDPRFQNCVRANPRASCRCTAMYMAQADCVGEHSSTGPVACEPDDQSCDNRQSMKSEVTHVNDYRVSLPVSRRSDVKHD